jgi:hypothetical protein
MLLWWWLLLREGSGLRSVRQHAVNVLPQGNSSLCCLPTLFQTSGYAHRPLLHVQICSCCRRYCVAATDRGKAAAAERNRTSTKATSCFPISAVCSNHSNMVIDLCFMFRYAVVAVVVVLGACDRVLAAAPPLTTMHLAVLVLFPYAQIIRIRPLTFVFTGICICYRGGCAWCLRLSSSCQASGYGRPPAHHYAPGRLATFSACANRLNMPIDL